MQATTLFTSSRKAYTRSGGALTSKAFSISTALSQLGGGEEARRVLEELAHAALTAEVVVAALMVGRVGSTLDLDRHPAHGVGRKLIQLGRDHHSPRLRPQWDDLGQSRERDLLLADALHPAGRRSNPGQRRLAQATLTKRVEDGLGPAPRGDQRHVQVRLSQGRGQRIFVVVAHRADNGPSVASAHAQGAKLFVGYGPRAEADELRQARQGPDDRSLAEGKQDRARDLRVDEDIQRAATGARGRHGAAARFSHLVRVARPRNPKHPREAVGKRSQRLAADRRLGAAAPDPAGQRAVLGDHGLVPGACGGGRLAAHDGGQHARRPVGCVLAQQVDELGVYSVTPFERRAAQTLSGPIGMSMLVIPYGESASMTALT